MGKGDRGRMSGSTGESGSVVLFVVVLLVWWAVWSLLDTYTLAYSPWSELLVLSMCLLVLVHRAWSRAGSLRRLIACGLNSSHASDMQTEDGTPLNRRKPRPGETLVQSKQKDGNPQEEEV